jgi:hypothetical protein
MEHIAAGGVISQHFLVATAQDRFWQFSDLAKETSVGLLSGAKRTYPDSVFDFRV